ncbi:hypothetical protein [Fibrobacter sp. UBA3629]|jgi:DNA mismatch repair ATPase MutL|uniref:hypothetical protein n=1 Tax=Fibrobacter sp. UBA3629 TaxID=1946530 RepID=UPI0025BC46D7|nr:hypothetical protein [Fibrobacter sp. UBA3629]
MNKKILTLLASMSLAFFMSACGDDNSSSTGVDCLENESCLDDDLSSASDDESSSSVKGKSSSSSKAKSSSSVKKDEKSSSSEKDAKSSSSKKDEKSSSSETPASSSSEAKSSSSEAVSSSSEEPESSSSVELKVTYLSETPNAADLEVSGDTLFAVFQRYVPVTGGADFKEPGLLAMYKLSDGTLLDTIPLLTKNPMAVKVVKGNVYVGTQGEYNPVTWGIDADDNRGIEKIDLKNKKSELWVSGAELGGGVNLMEVNAKEGKAYVAVYRAYGDVFVVEVDLASKSVKSVGKEVDATGGLFYDANKNLLYIGDRGVVDLTTFEASDMGVRAYDGTTFTSLTSEEPYEFLYQPYSITVAGGELFVYVSDYSSGALYWFEEGEFNDEDRIQFSADAVIRNVNGKLIVLDRGDKGSIAEVNTSAKTVAWQAALNKDNPYDIVAIDNNTAWVAMYDVGEIRKISLGDGSTISSIDTKEFSAKKVEVVE